MGSVGQLKQRLSLLLQDNDRSDRLLKRILNSNDFQNVNTKNSTKQKLVNFAATYRDGRTRSNSRLLGKPETEFLKNLVKITKAPKKSVKRMTQKAVRHPWFIVQYEPTRRSVKIVPTKVFGLSSVNGWSTDFVSSPDVYPLARTNRLGKKEQPGVNDSLIRTKYVGKICNSSKLTTSEKVRRGCDRISRPRVKPDEKYITVYSNDQEAIAMYKDGAGGLGVKQLAKIILRIGRVNHKSKAKARADFLELKRNGDYGQIFSCKMINDDDNIYLMANVSEELAPTIERKGETFQPENFYHNKCVFWSVDRPACLLAILLKVPVIRPYVVRNKTYFSCMYNIPSITSSLMKNYKKNEPETKAFRTLLQLIKVYLSGDRNAWFSMLCVIDTAHDFGLNSLRAKEVLSPNQMEMIKNILKSIVKPTNARATFWNDWVEQVWHNIKNVEDEIGQFITYLTKESKSLGNEELIKSESAYTKIHDRLSLANACLVYDAGPVPKGDLVGITSLLAPKYLDPAA